MVRAIATKSNFPLPFSNALTDGRHSVVFILSESRQHTVYAGGCSDPKLVVIPKDAAPAYIEIPDGNMPTCGILMKDETELIVGAFYSAVYVYSLAVPSAPSPI